jgi:plastocyanin
MAGFRAGVVVVLAAGIASCGGDSSSSAPQAAIQQAPSASGDAQTGTVAGPLASPLRVLVTMGGNPLAGETVAWSTVGAGASMSPAQSVTDASGIASSTWTLGQVAGSQSATASSSGAAGSPVTFTATATAGTPTQLVKVAGDSQVGVPGSKLSIPVAVKAGDAYGNSVAGIGVSWAVTSGPATVSPANANTGANGAQATVQLGASAGAVVVTATSAGLSGSPATFHERAAWPATAGVRIGDYFFLSARNGSENPAVDTIGVGGTVTWTWAGNESHSVQSVGSPSFTSSVVQKIGTYSVAFGAAGTYNYDCGVHGITMTGTVVVK